MWVSAIIGMATSFAESSLAQLYKERDSKGQFRGGPAWYMERGLGMRWMGVLFAIFLLIAYGLIFNSVQANSVSHALTFAFDIPPLFTGIALAIVSLLAIIGGIKGVARLMQWFVPMMALLWVGCSIVICSLAFRAAPRHYHDHYKKCLWLAGSRSRCRRVYTKPAIASGFQRGMFSNEAGMGSTPNAAASAASCASASCRHKALCK